MEKAVLCYKVDRLVALLPTFPSVCCLQYDVCKPLMPDIVADEVHQNGCLGGNGRLPRTIYQMYRAMCASDTGLGITLHYQCTPLSRAYKPPPAFCTKAKIAKGGRGLICGTLRYIVLDV